DEFILAIELQQGLEDAGAVILGPVGAVQDAVAAIDTTPALDGAVLDMNLGGEMAYPVADALIARRIPFILTTGYDASTLPPRFAHVARCQKPLDAARVARALRAALAGPDGPADRPNPGS
ncbi:hypothetical protein WDZ92_27145, partial [Nostoc sp. NIES-2111]